MDKIVQHHLANLQNKNAEERYASFQYLIKLTHQPVDWIYEARDEILPLLTSKDNHERAIGRQLLSGLAKSDTKYRLEKDLDKLFAVTKDEKFVMARHPLMSLWKVGVAGKSLQEKVNNYLEERFRTCTIEKNCTLIRYDIIAVFRKMFDQLKVDEIKNKALALI